MWRVRCITLIVVSTLQRCANSPRCEEEARFSAELASLGPHVRYLHEPDGSPVFDKVPAESRVTIHNCGFIRIEILMAKGRGEPQRFLVRAQDTKEKVNSARYLRLFEHGMA